MKTIRITTVFPSMMQFFIDELDNMTQWNPKSFKKVGFHKYVSKHTEYLIIFPSTIEVKSSLKFPSIRKGIKFNMNKRSVTIS